MENKFLIVCLSVVICAILFVPIDVIAQEPYFKAVFNPSGTKIENNILFVRFDLYPSSNSKSYNIHYIEKPITQYAGKLDNDGVPIDQDDFDKWFNEVEKIRVLNPVCCVFVPINESTSVDQLYNHTSDFFSSYILELIDNLAVSEPTKSEKELASWIINNKLKNVFGIAELPKDTDKQSLINQTNTKFSNLKIGCNR